MNGKYDYKGLGARIRDCRYARGMTQEQLAEKALISLSFVGHIERGEKQPSLETVVNISKGLSVSLDYLVMGRKGQCDANSCELRKDLQKLVEAYPHDLDNALI